jgi:putative acetyltransferase
MTDDAWSFTTLKPHLMEELVNLWVRSWQHTLPHIDFEARRDWFNEHMRELQINGAQTFCAIAHTNHQLIGFVTVNGDTHYLDQLAITPDRFGSALAKDLLVAAKQQSPELLELHVNQDNHRALRFYEREGFTRGAESINARSGLKVWHMMWTR